VTAGGRIAAGSFRAAYASALHEYLSEPTERSLRAAYELGREALNRGHSVLELAVVQQEALTAALAGASGPPETEHVSRAAGDFFLESLSAFEMVQRGYAEARAAAAFERRQTEMARQLSSFLADASLALDASDSLEEMLRLVAEQARELIGAECSLATVALGGQPRAAEAASCSDAAWDGFVRWLDLFAIYRLIRLNGGSIRVAGGQLAGMPEFRSAARGRRLRGFLGASFTTLGGDELGAIQLFDKEAGRFTAEDEAALVYLAQMTSAAVERTWLYRRSELPG
jgi:Phosphoserine phosphatase RsbU, N-terminal domain